MSASLDKERDCPLWLLMCDGELGLDVVPLLQQVTNAVLDSASNL